MVMAVSGSGATSTEPRDDDNRYQRRDFWARRVFVVLLAAFLLAAAVGVFGVRTVEKTASGGGYDLTVRYASVTRSGLASVWSVEVRSDRGFDGPITLANDASYFDMFDENGLDPEPTASTQDDERLEWEFDPPDGDVFVVSFDARIEPAAQWGATGRTRLLVDDAEVVAVSYTTTVMP